MIWERIPGCISDCDGKLKKNFDIQIEAEEAEHIVSVEDAVEDESKRNMAE